MCVCVCIVCDILPSLIALSPPWTNPPIPKRNKNTDNNYPPDNRYSSFDEENDATHFAYFNNDDDEELSLLCLINDNTTYDYYS